MIRVFIKVYNIDGAEQLINVDKIVSLNQNESDVDGNTVYIRMLGGGFHRVSGKVSHFREILNEVANAVIFDYNVGDFAND